jgi:hypothetical protein
MPLRPQAIQAAFGTMLAISAAAKTATASELGAAFQAAFGQPAPVTRDIQRPIYGRDHHEVAGDEPKEMDLWPDRMIQLGIDRWALLTKEYNQNTAHVSPGAIAVAYLHDLGGGWALEHSWPEIVYSGVGGEPANAGEEVRRFGSAPLYLATSEWCGMGACSDTVDAIRLAPSGPVYLGGVPGGGRFTAAEVFSDPDAAACKDYAYTASVGPPTTASGVFSVTYDGWTIPPKRRSTKTRFHLQADAMTEGNGLALKPKIHLPDCGQ